MEVNRVSGTQWKYMGVCVEARASRWNSVEADMEGDRSWEEIGM